MQKNPRGDKETKINHKIILQTGSFYFGSFSHEIQEEHQKAAIFGYFRLFLALKRLKTCEFERKPDQLPENAENMRFMSDLGNTDNKLGLNHLKQTAHAHVRTYLCRRFF